MPRSILSPVAALEVGVSFVPPTRTLHPGSRTLTPGQRISAGRAFYSAAWLDQATSTLLDPPALKRRRESGRERHAGDVPWERRAALATARVPSVDG